MTRQFNGFGEPTEFSNWLRKQPEIDSKYGYQTSNIDFMWLNKYSNAWMLLEEKRYNGKIYDFQRRMLNILHKAGLNDPNYRGVHLLQFEKTSPEDGRMWLNHVGINKYQLLQFLRFEITFDEIKGGLS